MPTQSVLGSGAPYPGSQYPGTGQQYGTNPLPQQGGGFYPGDRGKTDEFRAPPDISLPHLIEVAVLAWFAFSVVCMLFGLSYHDSSVEVWSLVILSSVALLMVVVQSWRQQGESSAARVSVIVAGWLLLAVLGGTVIGLFSYDCCIREYWMSQKLEARANVLPSEPAAAYSNAGEIVFADVARVDPSKSVGYKDHNVFCVAPVASDAPLDTIQFWAAGTDCCGSRGSFVCDDSWNPKARSGIVIRNATFEMMGTDLRAQYMKAVRLAEVTYAIASAKEPIFVRWVADPDQVELNVWRAGLGVLLAAVIIASLLCGLQACAIHMFLRRQSYQAYRP